MKGGLEDFGFIMRSEGIPQNKDLGGTGLYGGMKISGGEDFLFKILETQYQFYYFQKIKKNFACGKNKAEAYLQGRLQHVMT